MWMGHVGGNSQNHRRLQRVRMNSILLKYDDYVNIIIINSESLIKVYDYIKCHVEGYENNICSGQHRHVYFLQYCIMRVDGNPASQPDFGIHLAPVQDWPLTIAGTQHPEPPDTIQWWVSASVIGALQYSCTVHIASFRLVLVCLFLLSSIVLVHSLFSHLLPHTAAVHRTWPRLSIYTSKSHSKNIHDQTWYH